MFDLTGKRALITGATGGLGGDIARKLHAQGAHVALSGTRAEKLEELAHSLGERASVTPCNLSDGDAVDSLVATAGDALGGGIDILVSNAGLTRDGLLMRMKYEDWELVQRVNLDAYFRLSKACMRGMMKARWGRIIGITSIVGVTGNPGQTNYAASKAGMIGFINEAQTAATLAKVPMGKLGEGEDIANAVLYLASDEAGYVTGQTLHVNGG